MIKNDTLVKIIPYRPDDQESADAAHAAIAEPLVKVAVVHTNLGEIGEPSPPVHLFFGEREVQMMADIIERQKASDGAQA